MGRIRIKKSFPDTIIHKIFQTNSSFHVKKMLYEKGLIAVFWDIFASIKKKSILEGTMATRLSFYEVS